MLWHTVVHCGLCKINVDVCVTLARSTLTIFIHAPLWNNLARTVPTIDLVDVQGPISFFGISIKAPAHLLMSARKHPDIGVVTWLVNTSQDFLEAAKRADRYIISDKPILMLAVQRGKTVSELTAGDFCNATS